MYVKSADSAIRLLVHIPTLPLRSQGTLEESK